MVRLDNISETKVARFSLCTETSYTGTSGCIIETMWFSVTAWEGEKIRCLDQLTKGTAVRVSGRVRVQRYTDFEGAERQCWEVMAREVEIMER